MPAAAELDAESTETEEDEWMLHFDSPIAHLKENTKPQAKPKTDERKPPAKASTKKDEIPTDPFIHFDDSARFKGRTKTKRQVQVPWKAAPKSIPRAAPAAGKAATPSRPTVEFVTGKVVASNGKSPLQSSRLKRRKRHQARRR